MESQRDPLALCALALAGVLGASPLALASEVVVPIPLALVALARMLGAFPLALAPALVEAVIQIPAGQRCVCT